MMNASSEQNGRGSARSCTTCSIAKARCSRPPGATVCDRCARLKKDCVLKEPVLRRKKPTKTTRAAQLEKLEHKLEHLVNALSSNTQHAPSFRPPEHAHISPPSSAVSSSVEKAITQSREIVHAMCRGQDGADMSTSPDAPAAADYQVPSPEDSLQHAPVILTLHEQEVLLDRYLRLMSDGFPFVLVPHGSTAHSLQENRPVLLQAICVVAHVHDLLIQQKLLNQAIAAIGNRILVKNEKSLDLLQAILVITAWYQPHIFWCTQMTNLLHLAMALSIDLGLDRMSQLQDFRQMTTKAMHGPCLAYRVPSLEERRVLLGLYYITSMLSASFNKVNAMPFTPYMEDCLVALGQAQEYDSDLSLVQIIELQRVVQNAHSVETSNVPSRMYIKAFQTDLERLRKDDRTDGDNSFLKLQYAMANVWAWEPSLAMVSSDSTAKTISSHVEDLYGFVDAVKRFFEIWWSIPASTYLFLPFSVFGQYAHALISCVRLASLDIEGWDINVVNEQLSFLDIIDESMKRFDESTKTTLDGHELDNEAFGLWVVRIRWMKQAYKSKFRLGASPNDKAHVPGAANYQPTMSIGTPSSEPQMSGNQQMTQQEQPLPPAPQQSCQQQQQQQQHQPPLPPPPPDDFLSADFFGYLDESFWSNFNGGDYDVFLQDTLASNLNTAMVGGSAAG